MKSFERNLMAGVGLRATQKKNVNTSEYGVTHAKSNTTEDFKFWSFLSLMPRTV